MHVHAITNPFKNTAVDIAVAEGLNVAEIMRQVQPDPIVSTYAHVFVDDEYIMPDQWSTVTPTQGQIISVRVVPHGGDGKNPLATILSIAVMAVAPQLSGMMFTSKFAQAIGTAVIGMAGSLAINALVPPPRQDLSSLGSSGADSPTLSLSGARNSAGLYRPIPKIFGRHKITPYYGAQPYTELDGQDQYLRLLFVIGYGPLEISDLKIGETSLSDYDAVDVEIKQGYQDDTGVTLFPGTVVTSVVGSTLSQVSGWIQQTTEPGIDEFNVEITFASGLVGFQDDGDKISRTVNFEIEYSPTTLDTWTQARPDVYFGGETIEAGRAPGTYKTASGDAGGVTVSIVRYWLVYVNANTGRVGVASKSSSRWGAGSTPSTPSGCYPICSFTQSGSSRSVSAPVDLRPSQLTASGAGNFLATINATYDYKVDIAAGSFEAADQIASVSAQSTSAVRYGCTVPVSSGQYDVRVRRTSADTADTQIFDTATWSALKSIENIDPIQLDGLAKVAMRIKATDQLQGMIDEFNCIATSIHNAWDGTSWVEQATYNPADHYREVFQGAGMKEPVADSRLDLVEIEEWAEECDYYGYQYNAVIDYETTPFELARDICATGRAAFAMRDGLYSVVRDSGSADLAGVKQWLTPRNSWDVKGDKAFDEIHGVTFTYIDASADYRIEQVTAYKDGYTEGNATRVDELELKGITDHDQAWKQARYYLAVATLRPETHSRMVDAEHLVCSRGDLIRVTDDIALHGLYTGRIKSFEYDLSDVSGVVLDELVTMALGKTYGIRIRLADGTDVYRAVTTFEGETDTLELSTNILAIDAPETGDLAMFGESSQETSEKLVTRIEMSSDLSARVYYVDKAEEVWAENGDIPAYDPGISIPFDPNISKPEPPTILNIRSDETAAGIQEDGTFLTRIMVSIGANSGAVATANFECHYKLLDYDVAWSVLPVISASSGVIYIPDVIKGADYSIRVRAISSYGMVSNWVTNTHTVVGKTGSVPSVTDLWVENSTGDNLTFIEKDCHVIWTNAPDLWSDWRWMDYYLVEVLDTSDTLLHTEHVKTERFDLSFEKNAALTNGPYREFKVRVTVFDIFGQSSTPVTIQPVNDQAGQVVGVGATDGYGGSEIFWDNLQETALAGYEIHLSASDGFTPTVGTLLTTVGPNTNGYRVASVADGTYYVRIGAFDVFDAVGVNYSVQQEVIIDHDINVTDLIDFPLEISQVYSAPVLEADTWTNSLGTTLTWNAHSLWYNGIELNIAGGNTTDAYIYWLGPGATSYSHTDDVDVFQAIQEANEDFQIAINYGDAYELGWDSRANMVIGTAKIGTAAIENANIGNIIESTGFSAVEPASGWQLEKSGAIIARDLSLLNADGSILLQAGDTTLINIPIGSRNLITKETCALYGYFSATITEGLSGFGFYAQGIVIGQVSSLPLKSNTYYSLIFKAKSTVAEDILVDLYPDSLPETSFNLTTTITDFSWNIPQSSHADMDDTPDLRFYISAGSLGTVTITDIMLVEGIVSPTAWIQAPEDGPPNNAASNVGNNLVPNGDFKYGELAIDGESIPGWILSTVGTVISSSIWATTAGFVPPWGGVGERVYHGRTDDIGSYVLLTSLNFIPIDITITYCLACWAMGTSDYFNLRIAVYEEDKVTLLGYINAASQVALTGTYVQYSATVGPDGVNAWDAAAAYVKVEIIPCHYEPIDNYALVGRVSLNEGLYPALWGGADAGADATDVALSATTEITSGGLRITDTATTYDDYVELSPASLKFFHDDVLYNTVKRVEADDDAVSGTPVVFNPAFKTPPKITLFAKEVMSYIGGDSATDHTVELSVNSPSVDGFTPYARLVQKTGTDSTASFTINFSSSPGYRTTANTIIDRVTVTLGDVWINDAVYEEVSDGVWKWVSYFYAMNITVRYKIGAGAYSPSYSGQVYKRATYGTTFTHSIYGIDSGANTVTVEVKYVSRGSLMSSIGQDSSDPSETVANFISLRELAEATTTIEGDLGYIAIEAS